MTSPRPDLNEIEESFSLMDDWEDRYRYLIDLGKTLPPMPEELKIDANLVRGCTSKVWLLPEIRAGRLTFQADSDAHIVKGLVALAYILFNGQPIETARQIETEEIFKRLGLAQNLSPNRRNGFFSMIEKLKSAVTLSE